MSKGYFFWLGVNVALGLAYLFGTSTWGWINVVAAAAMALLAIL